MRNMRAVAFISIKHDRSVSCDPIFEHNSQKLFS
jgi:hypothetical protein